MRTRRSPRNQERLFRVLFQPAPLKAEPAPLLDLSKAFWLSPRAKQMIEADRLRAARKTK